MNARDEIAAVGAAAGRRFDRAADRYQRRRAPAAEPTGPGRYRDGPGNPAIPGILSPALVRRLPGAEPPSI